jgi:hypothetical protein
MKYYAKLTGPNPGGKKIYVEIWKTDTIDETNYDEKIAQKSFWTMGGAKRWSEKQIMKNIMSNQLKYFFIKDEDIIREEL